MKKFLLPALLIFASLLQAQEIDTDALLEGLDDESLFGLSEEEAVVEVEETESLPAVEAVTVDKFLWGGKVYSDLGSSLIWNDPEGAPDETLWDPRFGLELFFDARPSEDFRVFAKGKAFYPFDGSAENAFSLQELFADFNINNKVYFRAGKQTINWGVGYLYRPADILNLSPLDPMNRDADREGPLAVKTQIPLGVNALYVYAVADEIEHPEDITYALKGEFLLGNWEIGAGTIVNPYLSPKGALFVTGPLGKLDFFAEALFQYGSDRDFYDMSLPAPNTFRKEDQLIVSATGGLFFRDGDKRFLAIGQYWFDGEAQSAGDWTKVGHHFAGVTLEKGFVIQPDNHKSGIINLSVLWLGDFSDLSGMIMPEIEWEFTGHASVALGGTWRYGDETSYYRYRGPGETAPPMEVKLSLRLGYGNF